MNPKIAICLLSGGIDSTTTLAFAKHEGFDAHALSFQYGQRHQVELEAAKKVARHYNVTDHKIVEFSLRQWGGSALTSEEDVPRNRSFEQMGAGIANTYVPARNTVFLAFALAWAETLCSEDIFIGVNELDYAGFPDCREEYLQAYEKLMNLATAEGVKGHQHMKIQAPLLKLNKADIIRLGMGLGVDFSLTHSCYAPEADGAACGECDSCLLRRQGFKLAGYADPARYRISW